MAKVIQTSKSGSLQLSPNFYLAEFLVSNTATRLGLDNAPDPLAVQNLFKMAELMEKIRKLLGDRVVVVSSGFRSPAVNKAVGGSASSDHMRGEACDFVCNGFGTPLQVSHAIVKSSINFGQLIQEGSWVHISLPGGKHQRQVLTARFANGKASYTEGLV